MPPTERRGRVHSSTVTVAVLHETQSEPVYRQRNADDFSVEWYSGTVGAGGQNHQKTRNCARITHRPTGLIRTAQTRSRQNSFKQAMSALNFELDQLAQNTACLAENSVRRAQVGAGQRSDKRRTIRFQDGLVIDHMTGKRMPVDNYLRGEIDRLWGDCI